MNEEWRPIPNFDGYEASNKGRIRSVTRRVRCRNGFRTVAGIVLKCFRARKTGYLQVALYGKRQSAHRLIALTWCGGYFDGAWVDHLNGIRDDNRPENLQWVTPSENCARPYRNGTRANPFKGIFSGNHPTAKAVVATCVQTGARKVYASAMDAVREGFDSASISRCCRGMISYHKGHVWAFCDAHGVQLTETIKGGFHDPRARAA